MRRRFGTAVAIALMFGAFAFASGVAHATVGSTPPATPQIGGSPTSGGDGTIEVARQITQCGGIMYVGGTFTQVRDANSNTPVTRNRAFAFSAIAPYRLVPWNPNVNGDVYTVACAPDGDIYLGGQFTTVGGVAVRNLAKVDEVTGANVAAFTQHPAGRVNHVEVVIDQANVQHLLIGWNSAPYLRSVNALTGVDDTYVRNVPVSGTYQFTGAAANTTRIWNMSVFPRPYQPGSTTVNPAVLMTGIFTSVGGQHHEQVFRLNLTPGAATVSSWSPRELFNHCIGRQPFWAQDAAWSVDMTTVYVVSTGFHLWNEQRLPNGQWGPRTGPCDAAIAYNAEPQVEFGQTGGTGTSAWHNWINYTGCDSLYSVAADAQTVFIGGHQRWIDNTGCDRLGTGGRAQPGLGEITPSTGRSQPGPSRGRGLGAADMLRTADGLWIASDNQANTATCGTASARMGICFLPNG